jgi:hypothetical protein
MTWRWHTNQVTQNELQTKVETQEKKLLHIMVDYTLQEYQRKKT